MSKEAYLERKGKDWYLVDEDYDDVHLGAKAIPGKYDGAKVVQQNDEQTKSLGKVTMEMELKGSEEVKSELEEMEERAHGIFTMLDKIADKLQRLKD